MKYAICASFDGSDDTDYCETSLRDAERASVAAGLDWYEGDEGDSEYRYLGTVEGDVPEEWVEALMLLDRDDIRRERLRDKIQEKDGAFFALMISGKASGVVGFEELESFLESLGAYAEKCETGGTLGGPANPIGWAPDVGFNIESRALISSIRVTPLIEGEASWYRHRDWLIERFGC